jgi:hypothetical protein
MVKLGMGIQRRAAVVLLALSTMQIARVHAQAGGDARAAAQALFDSARTLMAQDNYNDACPKLEESQRLDPGVGTQFNLAVCYEAIGRNASAWSLFLEVAASAHRAAERAREEVARSRAATLEPKLSKLRIVVPDDARTAGLRVLRGTVAVGPGQWGVALPTDPGTYTITASAPGKRSMQVTISVPDDGDTSTITLGPLVDAPPEPRAAQATQPEPSWTARLGSQRVVGLGLGAGALLAAGTGSVFAVLALNDKSASQDDCDHDACNQDGLDKRNAARANGNRATVAFIAAGALAAGAVVLYVTGGHGDVESAEHARITVVPAMGPGALGVLASGRL